MMKKNEFKERYKQVSDERIKKYLQANPIRKLIDFEDPDNAKLEFISFCHEYVTHKNTAYGCENDLIIEYIECDSRFLGDVDLKDPD